METVQSWLRSLNMDQHAEVIFNHGVTSMLKVVSLKDEDLLSLGVTSPQDRQIILDSIANINSLNSEASVQEASFSVRDTKDPKLMRSLLALVSELFNSSTGSTRHRVVIDKVERVRNEPLSLAFKRHLKSLPSQDVLQRLFLPPIVDPMLAGRNGVSSQIKDDHILADGFKRCVSSGPFGTGLYFPSSLTVFKSNTVFKMIVCDVALGKNLLYSQDAAGGVPNLQNGVYDSVSFSPGLVNKVNVAMKEDLGVKSPLQAVARYVVTFTLHSTESNCNILVVSADGSGDHRSIGDAVDAAAKGDLVLLRPGVYLESLHLEKDIHLMASQAGSAVIDSSITLSSNCQLTGINVRPQDGGSVAVSVAGGSPTLTHCDVAGMIAVTRAAQVVLRECNVHDSAAHGVHVAEKSTCLVEKCVLEGIELCGVQVDGGARGVIMNSQISFCKQNGVYLLDGAKGVIEGCNIFGCAFPGIAVNAADPVISRNRIHHNERSGLVIAGKSEDNTLVEDNNVFSNGRDGIMIAKDAVCLLQGNSVFDNKGAGVQIMTGATPHLIKTHIFNNKESGVLVGRGGNAHISDCQIFANAKSGILVAKTTSVLVDGCDIFTNSPSGIEVQQQATPKIVHNRIHHHQTNVVVEKKAAPTIQGNEIFAGTVSGLQLQDQCEPIILANTIHSNGISVACSTPAMLTKLDLKAKNSLSEK